MCNKRRILYNSLLLFIKLIFIQYGGRGQGPVRDHIGAHQGVGAADRGGNDKVRQAAGHQDGCCHWWVEQGGPGLQTENGV